MSESVLFEGIDSAQAARIKNSLNVLCSLAKERQEFLSPFVSRKVLQSLFPDIPDLFAGNAPEFFREEGSQQVRWRLIQIKEEKELPKGVFTYMLWLKRYVSTRI